MNLYELPIHPLAAAIPMSSDDDIQALAERMKEHGQRVPVSIAEIDGVMMLIDGRHRLAAAKLIDLELTHEVIDGSDEFINAYIFDFMFTNKKPNISQQAMWEAMENPEGKQGERNDTTSVAGDRSVASRTTVKNARFVLKHSSYLTGEVLAGRMMVKPAYETAKAEKATQEFLKERTKVLQDESPEHAERVANGEDLNTVFEEYKRELEVLRASRLATVSNYKRGLEFFGSIKCSRMRKRLSDAINSSECSEGTRKLFKKNIEDAHKNLTKMLGEF